MSYLQIFSFSLLMLAVLYLLIRVNYMKDVVALYKSENEELHQILEYVRNELKKMRNKD